MSKIIDEYKIEQFDSETGWRIIALPSETEEEAWEQFEALEKQGYGPLRIITVVGTSRRKDD